MSMPRPNWRLTAEHHARRIAGWSAGHRRAGACGDAEEEHG